MATTKSDAVVDILDRLGDLKTEAWSYDEIGEYLQEGYDLFCRRTKCLYDQWNIENLPVIGNWQTDFERYLMEQKPGRGLTDQPMGFTGEHERSLGTSGKYGGSYGKAPTPATSPSEAQGTKGDATGSDGFFGSGSTGSVSSGLPTKVPGGDLPRSVVSILDVYYDRRRIRGTTTQHLRQLDPDYENRQGDPQYFTWDKDGLFYLGVVPSAGGDATYINVDGQWGTMRQTDETMTEVTQEVGGKSTGGWGILRHSTSYFPANGPWGTPKRRHPDAKGIMIELYRLGKNLDNHHIETPDAYTKYLLFYAMSKALERPGPGQDLDRAQHYAERFEMGVDRMQKKANSMSQEYQGQFGSDDGQYLPFGLGDPQPPLFNWEMEL